MILKVSAIVTTYMREPDMVIRAIDSIVGQTYKNIEIIVVDDSPTTYEKRDLVRRLIESRYQSVRYIAHDKNMGACVARNTGIKVASGQYVAFLDDDDEWLPEKIERELACFTDDMALVYSPSITMDEKTGREKTEIGQPRTGYVFDKLILKNFIGSTSIPLIRKRCLDEVGGFDPMMRSAQDYDLWLRLAEKYTVGYVETPLIRYHIHSGEQISKNVKQKIAGQERLIEKNAAYLGLHPYAWWLRHIRLATQYAADGQVQKALKLWCRAVEKNPGSVIENSKYLLKIAKYYTMSKM